VLSEGGVLSVNLFGRNGSFTRSARRIASAFAPGGGQVRMLAPTEEGNTIVVAVKGPGGPDHAWPDDTALRERADLVTERCGLKAVRWLGLIKPLPAPRRRAATPSLEVPQ
jgi:hypothetical protein